MHIDRQAASLGSKGARARLFRRPRIAARGFSLLELAVVVIVLGVVASMLLSRLRFYQEAAEKANVETTIGAVKSALRSRMASLLVEGRAQEYVQLAQQNPLDWLDVMPPNYVGKLPLPGGAGVPPGSWYFDPEDRMLVYMVKNGNYFEPDSMGRKRIRLRVVLNPNFAPGSPDRSPDAHLTDSVSIALVERYRWFDDVADK